MSQAELGRRLGLKSSTSMWKYEVGASEFSAELLIRVAGVLGVPIQELAKLEPVPQVAEPVAEYGARADGADVFAGLTPDQIRGLLAHLAATQHDRPITRADVERYLLDVAPPRTGRQLKRKARP